MRRGSKRRAERERDAPGTRCDTDAAAFGAAKGAHAEVVADAAANHERAPNDREHDTCLSARSVRFVGREELRRPSAGDVTVDRSAASRASRPYLMPMPNAMTPATATPMPRQFSSLARAARRAPRPLHLGHRCGIARSSDFACRWFAWRSWRAVGRCARDPRVSAFSAAYRGRRACRDRALGVIAKGDVFARIVVNGCRREQLVVANGWCVASGCRREQVVVANGWCVVNGCRREQVVVANGWCVVNGCRREQVVVANG